MRLALITGGSKGLGQALCEQMRALGYSVIEFSRSGRTQSSRRLDLADPSQASDAVRSTLADIDVHSMTELVVFSNAGSLAPIGPVWAKPTPDVIHNVNVNFTSPILIIGEVVQHFRDTPAKKVLVNITSGAALKGYAGWSLYCASKAGLESFFRALAVEERAQIHPFTCISVDPGVIDTDMQALIRATSAEDFPEVERFIRRKEAGGLSPASRVAKAVANLVSRSDLESGARYDAFTEA